VSDGISDFLFWVSLVCVLLRLRIVEVRLVLMIMLLEFLLCGILGLWVTNGICVDFL